MTFAKWGRWPFKHSFPFVSHEAPCPKKAEEIVFGGCTTGASNDIEQTTKLARAMITRRGMSADFDMVATETVTDQYLGGDTPSARHARQNAAFHRKALHCIK